MNLLTKKHQRSHENVKVYYIWKEKFENKYGKYSMPKKFLQLFIMDLTLFIRILKAIYLFTRKHWKITFIVYN